MPGVEITRLIVGTPDSITPPLDGVILDIGKITALLATTATALGTCLPKVVAFSFSVPPGFPAWHPPSNRPGYWIAGKAAIARTHAVRKARVAKVIRVRLELRVGHVFGQHQQAQISFLGRSSRIGETAIDETAHDVPRLHIWRQRSAARIPAAVGLVEVRSVQLIRPLKLPKFRRFCACSTLACSQFRGWDFQPGRP